MAPCEDRGADLFLLARDGKPPVEDLEAHLAGCEGCRAEVDRLRALAGALPAASAGIRPRPSTKTDLMKEIEAVLAAEEAAPPPRVRRALPLWVPAAALAASLLVTVLVLTRQAPPGPEVGVATQGAVEVRPVWGAALDGLAPGRLPAGSVLTARGTSSVRLGAPCDAEVVLAEGTRLRLPAAGAADGSLLLEAGAAWFAPAGPGVLRVKAGAAVVSGSGRFTVEIRASGLVSVIVESGNCAVEAGGVSVSGPGPFRTGVEPGGTPASPVPSEATDATGWFSHPDLLLSLEPGDPGEPPGILLALRPSVPREIPIAPWDRFDPLFTLRVTHPERGLLEAPVGPRMLGRPAPPAGGDGTFLIGPGREYRLHLDLRLLALPPGRYTVEAVYAANRSGGPWRGTRASNAVELVIE